MRKVVLKFVINVCVRTLVTINVNGLKNIVPQKLLAEFLRNNDIDIALLQEDQCLINVGGDVIYVPYFAENGRYIC